MDSLTLAVAVFCGVLGGALLTAWCFKLTGLGEEEYARWQGRIEEAGLQSPRERRDALYEITDGLSSATRIGDRWRYRPEIRRMFYFAVGFIAAAIVLALLREWFFHQNA